MKIFFNKLLFISIVIIVFFFSIMLFLSKKDDFSYEENRQLINYSYVKHEEYFSDHFPMRIQLIKLKNKIEKLLGKQYFNGVYVGKDDYLIPGFIDNSQKAYLISSINEFAKNNPQTDVMIVPDSILINDNKLPFHKIENENEEIDYLYNNIKANTIDVRDILKEKNQINDVYYKTDHHWTTYGAYVAYMHYVRQKGMIPLPEEDFNIKKVSDSFLGTSSSLALGLAKKEDIYIYDYDNDIIVDYVLDNKRVNSLYNFDYLDKKDKYALFLDNNHSLIEITNKKINNNKSIIIIKNSYANAFIPFLVNHYQKIYVIDLRYYNSSVTEFIQNNGINDILILYNLNNMYSDISLIKLK